MRHFFTLDGRPSRDYNLYLASSTMWDAPERDVEVLEIPGRSGALIYDNGRYKNFAASVFCYVPHGMQKCVPAAKGWLAGNSGGYVRYEDSIHTDVYRMARVKSYTIEDADRVGASVKIDLDCKPQVYLKSGEELMPYTSGDILYNPTACTALPLIVCNGNGQITLNGVTMVISGNSGQICIDCDLQDAYDGDTNKNAYITPYFPVLQPDENQLTYSGVTGLKIAPRWWTV